MILDSRGNPTVEVDCYVDGILTGRAAVPSGASTGAYEALEMRDGDSSKYLGKGVSQAVENITQRIEEALVGLPVDEQKIIDEVMIELDGTPNKSSLGANAMLGVSLACLHAGAAVHELPLWKYIGGVSGGLMPVPMLNILNGGAHAASNVDVQEFMVMPHGFDTFEECLRAGVETYHALKKELKSDGLLGGVGDEGGFAPEINSSEEALSLISEAISSSGYKVDKEVTFALDCASTEIFKDGNYIFSDNNKMSNKELIQYLTALKSSYPITSIEDGLDENDWQGWADLTNKMGKQTQLVGDDLFVTNKDIFQRGIQENVANSILIKINQIGTLTETIETIKLAKENNYTTVISHRSGETEDSFIADLAVGSGAGQIKTGAPSRSDRTSKYNRLLMIDAWENLEFLGRSELEQ